MIHRLRSSESSDFDWLFALHRQGRVDAVGDAERRARFTRAFATEEIQVVEVDGDRVGMLSVDWPRDPVALRSIQLAAAWQGRGLGTRLVHDVLLAARQVERGVEVELPAENPARVLFVRLGFKEIGFTPSVRRLRWEASIRSDVTLEAAMSPWLDPRRRRVWGFRLFERAPDAQIEFSRFVAGRHGLPDDARVLDVSAGTGRRLRPLAAQGFTVTALETDPDLRIALAQVALVAGDAVTLGAAGLTQLVDDEAYDLALAFDGALWALLSHEARVDALARLRRALRPGGVLVIEGPNALARLHGDHEAAARTELYHRAHVSRIPRQDFDFHEGVLDRRDAIVVEIEGEEVAEWTERRRESLMGLPLLREALRAAGWRDFETFRDLQGTVPATVSGSQIVVVARR